MNWFQALGIAVALAAPQSQAPTYDPLVVNAATAVRHEDCTVRDVSRQRDLPVRLYLPGGNEPAPVLLFSHGLGGTCKGNAFLGGHWARRGYVCVFVQHPGSDDSVWRDAAVRQRTGAMKRAASAENFLHRVKDVRAVLDRLTAWNMDSAHPLAGRLDLSRIGMSGHSFGAVTTQAVSGQSFARRGPAFTDSRIKAAVAFSPSSPRGGDAATAFGSVKVPWMLMTGTRDVALIGDADLPARLAVFPALPSGDKYELVLFDAEHSAFSDRVLPGDRAGRNPNHHRAILALSTAFWDTVLRGDPAARAWLEGDGPRSVLEPRDRWQRR
jgi:predicted dienelactone hydrolase